MKSSTNDKIFRAQSGISLRKTILRGKLFVQQLKLKWKARHPYKGLIFALALTILLLRLLGVVVPPNEHSPSKTFDPTKAIRFQLDGNCSVLFYESDRLEYSLNSTFSQLSIEDSEDSTSIHVNRLSREQDKCSIGIGLQTQMAIVPNISINCPSDCHILKNEGPLLRANLLLSINYGMIKFTDFNVTGVISLVRGQAIFERFYFSSTYFFFYNSIVNMILENQQFTLNAFHTIYSIGDINGRGFAVIPFGTPSKGMTFDSKPVVENLDFDMDTNLILSNIFQMDRSQMISGPFGGLIYTEGSNIIVKDAKVYSRLTPAQIPQIGQFLEDLMLNLKYSYSQTFCTELRLFFDQIQDEIIEFKESFREPIQTGADILMFKVQEYFCARENYLENSNSISYFKKIESIIGKMNFRTKAETILYYFYWPKLLSTCLNDINYPSYYYQIVVTNQTNFINTLNLIRPFVFNYQTVIECLKSDITIFTVSFSVLNQMSFQPVARYSYFDVCWLFLISFTVVFVVVGMIVVFYLVSVLADSVDRRYQLIQRAKCYRRNKPFEESKSSIFNRLFQLEVGPFVQYLAWFSLEHFQDSIKRFYCILFEKEQNNSINIKSQITMKKVEKAYINFCLYNGFSVQRNDSLLNKMLLKPYGYVLKELPEKERVIINIFVFYDVNQAVESSSDSLSSFITTYCKRIPGANIKRANFEKYYSRFCAEKSLAPVALDHETLIKNNLVEVEEKILVLACNESQANIKYKLNLDLLKNYGCRKNIKTSDNDQILQYKSSISELISVFLFMFVACWMIFSLDMTVFIWINLGKMNIFYLIRMFFVNIFPPQLLVSKNLIYVLVLSVMLLKSFFIDESSLFPRHIIFKINNFLFWVATWMMIGIKVHLVSHCAASGFQKILLNNFSIAYFEANYYIIAILILACLILAVSSIYRLKRTKIEAQKQVSGQVLAGLNESVAFKKINYNQDAFMIEFLLRNRRSFLSKVTEKFLLDIGSQLGINLTHRMKKILILATEEATKQKIAKRLVKAVFDFKKGQEAKDAKSEFLKSFSDLFVGQILEPLGDRISFLKEIFGQYCSKFYYNNYKGAMLFFELLFCSDLGDMKTILINQFLLSNAERLQGGLLISKMLLPWYMIPEPETQLDNDRNIATSIKRMLGSKPDSDSEGLQIAYFKVLLFKRGILKTIPLQDLDTFKSLIEEDVLDFGIDLTNLERMMFFKQRTKFEETLQVRDDELLLDVDFTLFEFLKKLRLETFFLSHRFLFENDNSRNRYWEKLLELLNLSDGECKGMINFIHRVTSKDVYEFIKLLCRRNEVPSDSEFFWFLYNFLKFSENFDLNIINQKLHIVFTKIYFLTYLPNEPISEEDVNQTAEFLSITEENSAKLFEVLRSSNPEDFFKWRSNHFTLLREKQMMIELIWFSKNSRKEVNNIKGLINSIFSKELENRKTQLFFEEVFLLFCPLTIEEHQEFEPREIFKLSYLLKENKRLLQVFFSKAFSSVPSVQVEFLSEFEDLALPKEAQMLRTIAMANKHTQSMRDLSVEFINTMAYFRQFVNGNPEDGKHMFSQQLADLVLRQMLNFSQQPHSSLAVERILVNFFLKFPLEKRLNSSSKFTSFIKSISESVLMKDPQYLLQFLTKFYPGSQFLNELVLGFFSEQLCYSHSYRKNILGLLHPSFKADTSLYFFIKGEIASPVHTNSSNFLIDIVRLIRGDLNAFSQTISHLLAKHRIRYNSSKLEKLESAFQLFAKAKLNFPLEDNGKPFHQLFNLKRSYDAYTRSGKIRLETSMDEFLNKENETLLKKLKIEPSELRLFIRIADNCYSLKDIQSIISFLNVSIEHRETVKNIMMIFREKRIFAREDLNYVDLRRHSELFGEGYTKIICWASIFLIQKDFDLFLQLVNLENMAVHVQFYIDYFSMMYFYCDSQPRDKSIQLDHEQSINCREHFFSKIAKINLINPSLLVLSNIWPIAENHNIKIPRSPREEKVPELALHNQFFFVYSCYVLLKMNIFEIHANRDRVSWRPNTEFIDLLILFRFNKTQIDNDTPTVVDNSISYPEKSNTIYQSIKIKNHFLQLLSKQSLQSTHGFTFDISLKEQYFPSLFSEEFSIQNFYYFLNVFLLRNWISKKQNQDPKVLRNIENILQMDPNFCCFTHPLITIERDCLIRVFLAKEYYNDFVNSILNSLLEGLSKTFEYTDLILPELASKWRVTCYSKPHHHYPQVASLIDFTLLSLLEAHTEQMREPVLQDEDNSDFFFSENNMLDRSKQIVTQREFESRFSMIFKLLTTREYLEQGFLPSKAKRTYCWRLTELLMLRQNSFAPRIDIDQTGGMKNDITNYFASVFNVPGIQPSIPSLTLNESFESENFHTFLIKEMITNSMSRKFLKTLSAQIATFPAILEKLDQMLSLKNSFANEFVDDKLNKLGLPFEEFRILTALMNFGELTNSNIAILAKKFETVFKSNIYNLLNVMQLLKHQTIDVWLKKYLNTNETETFLHQLIFNQTDSFRSYLLKIPQISIKPSLVDDLELLINCATGEIKESNEKLKEVILMVSSNTSLSPDQNANHEFVENVLRHVVCGAELNVNDFFYFISSKNQMKLDKLIRICNLVESTFKHDYREFIKILPQDEQLILEAFPLEMGNSLKLLGILSEMASKDFNVDTLDDYINEFLSFGDYNLVSININNSKQLIYFLSALQTQSSPRILQMLKDWNLKSEYAYVLSFYTFFSRLKKSPFNERKLSTLSNDYIFILFMLVNLKVHENFSGSDPSSGQEKERESIIDKNIKVIIESAYERLADTIFHYNVSWKQNVERRDFLQPFREEAIYSIEKMPTFLMKVYYLWNENFLALFSKSGVSSNGNFLQIVENLEQIQIDPSSIHMPEKIEKIKATFGHQEGINFSIFEILLCLKQMLNSKFSSHLYEHSIIKIIEELNTRKEKNETDLTSFKDYIAAIYNIMLQPDLTLKLQKTLKFRKKITGQSNEYFDYLQKLNIQTVADFGQILWKNIKAKKLDESLPLLRKFFENIEVPPEDVYSFVKIAVLIMYNMKSSFVVHLNFKSKDEAFNFLLRGNQVQSRQLIESGDHIYESHFQEEWANVTKYAVVYRKEILSKKKVFGTLTLNIFDSFFTNNNYDPVLALKVFSFIYRENKFALHLFQIVFRNVSCSQKTASRRKSGGQLFTKSLLLEINSIVFKYLKENSETFERKRIGIPIVALILKIFFIHFIVICLVMIRYVDISEQISITIMSLAYINAAAIIILEFKSIYFN